MCGIVGFVNFSGHARDEAQARIKRMADSLLHRGPDEEGLFANDVIAFGHRRLAIIDLRGGQQPMSTQGGQVQIVFNGEIYNFLELRTELERKGHSFRTRCDTEVILLGYIEWGEKCIEKLSGMFSFAIWDERVKKLLVARDRVGKKPLYYYHNGSTFAFASELKALCAGAFFSNIIDAESLDCYFTFSYIPAPRTIYKNVRKLRAAKFLVVSEGSVFERQYWRLSFEDQRPRKLHDAADELEALLDVAVNCRLMSDVPIGAFLSGGLDSSLVVSSMARLMGRPVITNSIGFEEKEVDELPVARAVAEYLKTEHHDLIVKPHAADVLGRISWHFDEPFGDSSAVPTWYLCQMAKQNVTVALSGDGGDEGFGGYTFRYIPHLFEARTRRAVPAIVRYLLFGGLGAAWPASARLPRPLRLRTILENLSVSDAEAFYRDLSWLREDDREKLYSDDFLETLHGFTPREALYPLYTSSDTKGPLERSQFTDLHFYMTDDVLVKVDRMSMAHSLEVRCPFLDHRILEFAATLPASLKTNFRKGKLVLREVVARRLPLGVEDRPKQGFSIPMASWLRHELREQMEEVLFDKSSMLAEYLTRPKLQQLWGEHLSGRRDNSVVLWSVMILGIWEKVCNGRALSAI